MKRQKTLSLILALLLILTLSACLSRPPEGAPDAIPGDSADSIDPPSEEAPSEEAPSEEIPTEEAPTEDPPSEVIVETVAQFIAALRPGATILIPESTGLLLISEDGYQPLNEYGETENPNVLLTYTEDGYSVTICELDGLTIRGTGTHPASVTSGASESYVLRFFDCDDLRIENLSVGHLSDTQCDGGVFYMVDCDNVTIKDTDMYGCGTEGLYLENVVGLNVIDSTIYDCTYHLMTITYSRDLTFTNTVFRESGLGYGSLVNIRASRDILFDRCFFNDNESFIEYYFFDADFDSQEILVKDCAFNRNKSRILSRDTNVIFEDCEFQDNDFDTTGTFEEGGYWLHKKRPFYASAELEDIIALMTGEWICTGVLNGRGSAFESPDDLDISAWIDVWPDGALEFSLYDAGYRMYASTSLEIDRTKTNSWSDGSYVGWGAMFSSDDGLFEAQMLPYHEYLQIYLCTGEYVDDEWFMMLSFERSS